MVPNNGIKASSPREHDASPEHDCDLLFMFTTNQIWNMFFVTFSPMSESNHHFL